MRSGSKAKPGANRRSLPLRPSFAFEREALASGARRIAGVDEAGRGPLAGPVVAAAVVLSMDEPIEGLNDSKLLTAEKRSLLFSAIEERALAVEVGIVPPETIDRLNILQATRAAMSTAVRALSPPPDYLLIDGRITLDLDIPQQAVVKGDRLSFSIAAAGIVAKVTRDEIMKELHELYPQYGFRSHKGYPTRSHKEAIRRHGPSPVHRKTFRGVKEYLLSTKVDG